MASRQAHTPDMKNPTTTMGKDKLVNNTNKRFIHKLTNRTKQDIISAMLLMTYLNNNPKTVVDLVKSMNRLQIKKLFKFHVTTMINSIIIPTTSMQGVTFKVNRIGIQATKMKESHVTGATTALLNPTTSARATSARAATALAKSRAWQSTAWRR